MYYIISGAKFGGGIFEVSFEGECDPMLCRGIWGDNCGLLY